MVMIVMVVTMMMMVVREEGDGECIHEREVDVTLDLYCNLCFYLCLSCALPCLCVSAVFSPRGTGQWLRLPCSSVASSELMTFVKTLFLQVPVDMDSRGTPFASVSWDIPAWADAQKDQSATCESCG